MYKKILVCLLVFGLLSTILAACAIRDEAGTSGPEAHMGSATFVQSSVTINKGDSLTLVDDVAAGQIIKNRAWKGKTQQPPEEKRAPTGKIKHNCKKSAPRGTLHTYETSQ